MYDIPQMKDWEDIDYLRFKNDIKNLPAPLQKLFVEMLKQIKSLNLEIENIKNNSVCKECKYFDK